MGAKKGQNNFKQAQESKTSSRLASIKTVLSEIPKGITFDSSKSLASFVAEKIGVHRTTVTRNKKYMAEITVYFGEKYIPDSLNPDEANADQLREILKTEQMKVANRERSIARLQNIISNGNIISNENTKTLDNKPSNGVMADDVKFTELAHAFALLLPHIEELGLNFDAEKLAFHDEVHDMDIMQDKGLAHLAEFIREKGL